MIRLGGRQRRVLEKIRWAHERWGPVEVTFHVETLANHLPLDVQGVNPRAAYLVALRLEELGLVELLRNDAGQPTHVVPSPEEES